MAGALKSRFATPSIEPVLRRLSTLAGLSEAELALAADLAGSRQRHAVGEVLVAEGDNRGASRFVVAGWATRQRILPDGRRQIFGFALPGDLCGGVLPPPCPLVALTAVETVDATPLLKAARSGQAPGLARALAREQVIDQAILFDHMVRLGRQTAYERVAHFLLELRGRLQIAGLGDAQRFPMPLTQEVLADVLGLSIVHVNRTLQQLRRERLIELRSGVAILLQPDVLAQIADYRSAAA